MNCISPYFCEAVTLDTRSESVQWFKTMNDAAGEQKIDESKFKSAIRSMTGKFDKPVLVTESVVSSYGYVNDNWRYYTPSYGKYNSKTLVRPFPKPVLKNHDRWEDPLGRIITSQYEDVSGLSQVQLNDLKTRTGYVKAFAYIVGQDNIEKVMDERFLTISIGGVSPDVRCSVCNINLIHEHCEHELGEMYEVGEDKSKKKVLCYLKYGPQEYREYSYVSAPADKASHTQRYFILAPQDCLISDYSELVRGAITENKGFDDPYVTEDTRYFMADQDFQKKKLFCMSDAKEYAYDSLFNIPSKEAKKTTGATEDSERSDEMKTNVEQTTHKEVKVTLEEARLEDILKLGIVADHVASVRKDDATTIQTLEDKVKEHESTISSKDEEITAFKKDIEDRDKTITARDATIKEHDDAETVKKVEKLVDLYIALEKPQAKEVIAEADDAKKVELRIKLIESVSKRSVDSVNDAIADLEAEKKDKPEGDSDLSTKIDNDVDTKDTKKTGNGAANMESPIAKVLDKEQDK